ncbi:MAG: hypothetical protein WBS19_06880 [Candidatus Korobacteraceae bacterium]
MTQKKSENNGRTRATLADIAREMAKTRMTESVREAVEVAEARDARTHLQVLIPRKGRG